MAIAAFVFGIGAAVGIFFFGVPSIIFGPIAIYLGLRSRRQIRASGGTVGGYGLAQAGWIVGLAAAILGALFLLVYILVIVFLGMRVTHPEG